MLEWPHLNSWAWQSLVVNKQGQFLTACHYFNSQNSLISFDYSWFLANNLSNFVSLPWKLHNPYCHSVQSLVFREDARSTNIWVTIYYSNYWILKDAFPSIHRVETIFFDYVDISDEANVISLVFTQMSRTIFSRKMSLLTKRS